MDNITGCIRLFHSLKKSERWVLFHSFRYFWISRSKPHAAVAGENHPFLAPVCPFTWEIHTSIRLHLEVFSPSVPKWMSSPDHHPAAVLSLRTPEIVNPSASYLFPAAFIWCANGPRAYMQLFNGFYYNTLGGYFKNNLSLKCPRWNRRCYPSHYLFLC